MERTDNKLFGPKFFKGVKIAAVIVVFGVLMAVREEFSDVWVRALIAGIAFGILALGLLQVIKRST